MLVFARIKNGHRKGVSIVEGILLMLILGITLWAIMSTAAWSVEIQAFTRRSIDMRVLVSGCFEIFEAHDPKDPAFMKNSLETAAKILDPRPVSGRKKSDYKYDIQGFVVEASADAGAEGARNISLTVHVPEVSKTKAPLVIRRQVNTMSNETVSDDATT
ncbi:MAG: hypothetical protein LBC93_07890 [Synergistaceae bacterium]|jgi:hypothetical protein|nr:hypothetical protein [Synergistaceae bacterium]